MKTLLFLLIFAVGRLTIEPVMAVEGNYITVVAAPDSVAPTYRNGRLYSPPSDKIAVLSFAAGLFGFFSLLKGLFLPFLVLVTASVVLGVIGLVRIRKSHGQRGGRLLAWLAIITGTFWLTVTMLFITRVWVLP